MTFERFLSDRVTLHCGDCRSVLIELPECSLDACVTDPPYHLTSIVQRFAETSEADDTITSERVRNRADGYARLVAGGFMGKRWDGGDVAFDPTTWRAVYRVLKPGAYLLAMGGTRTYHRLACAIEDAGFEVRDMIAWTYGSGFPKSHDVSKAIDRAAGAEREVVGVRQYADGTTGHWGLSDKYAQDAHTKSLDGSVAKLDTAPATDAARQWEGWGTALKPALEPICMARKPLSEGTIAANMLRWGTGALNIDGCRIAADWANDPNKRGLGYGWTSNGDQTDGMFAPDTRTGYDVTKGRWPANLIHDGSEDVRQAFPDSAGQQGDIRGTEPSMPAKGDVVYGFRERVSFDARGDSGSAARFFYTAKADRDDRLGSKHPTVKPLDLMQYLCRLVTPKGGTVLDPFAGTGTAGEAAWREGMSAELVEAEAEYQADIRRRMALALSGPDERARESIKAKNLPRDDGPLFAPRDDYNATDDFARSIDEAYRAIRERKKNGGKGWGAWE